MFPTDDEEKHKKIPHYYGDIVRVIFVIAGILMLVFLPIFKDLIVVPVGIAIFVIISVDLFAGLTNPLQKWISLINLFISLSAFIIFETIAVEIIPKMTSRILANNNLLTAPGIIAPNS